MGPSCASNHREPRQGNGTVGGWRNAWEVTSKASRSMPPGSFYSVVYLFHLLPFRPHFHFLRFLYPPLPAKLHAAAWGLSYPGLGAEPAWVSPLLHQSLISPDFLSMSSVMEVFTLIFNLQCYDRTSDQWIQLCLVNSKLGATTTIIVLTSLCWLDSNNMVSLYQLGIVTILPLNGCINPFVKFNLHILERGNWQILHRSALSLSWWWNRS